MSGHPTDQLNQDLQSFEVNVLEMTDVVASELKRFNTSYEGDTRALVQLDLIEHQKLVGRFLSAADA